MVANTDIKPTNTSLLLNTNYFMPEIKTNLSQNLFHPIESWTKDDVEKWIEYCINEYSIGDINLNDFKMNGKALLLMNEDGFKQRSPRSGDILYRALQQHTASIKSLNCQTYQYPLWNNFPLLSASLIRHINLPLSYPPPPPPSGLNYLHPAFQQSINRLQTSFSNTQIPNLSIKKTDTPLPVKQASSDDEDVDIEQNETVPTPSLPLKSEVYSRVKQPSNESSRQVRYYQDRIDFHGDIIMKPPGAKNCRILWEFLFILLEDPHYESVIHWEDREKMIFRIIQADKLAALWGLQKNRLSMTYEKLSRGMRYYYANNIIAKEQSRRLLYRFMRTPDEIRKSVKRHNNSTSLIYSTKTSPSTVPTPTNHYNHDLSSEYLPLFSNLTPSNSLLIPVRNNSISKSDRASSSSPESLDSSHDSEKQYCSPSSSSSSLSSSSTKRKQAVPMSLTNRLSHNYSCDQPLNLAVPKDEGKYVNYKKQKFIYTPSSI